jgi:hypothetical protein
MRRRTRISQSLYLGPFRLRLSAPLGGRGRVWGSAGVRTGRRGWASVSAPLGARKRRR